MRNYYQTQIMIPGLAPCVKALLISNVVCWFALILVLQGFFLKEGSVYHFLGFVPSKVSSQFYVWQFVTYMFIHSQDIFHILFNMMVLWMFGSELESLWRQRFFLTYYLVCGASSALIYLIGVKTYIFFKSLNLGSSDMVASAALSAERNLENIPMIGASGAIFGLLLAYGLIFRDRIILFMFIFPMKARNFTLLIAAIELLSVLRSGFGSPVANLAHLGGLISGFLFLRLRGDHQRKGGLFSFLRLKKKRGFRVISNGRFR